MERMNGFIKLDQVINLTNADDLNSSETFYDFFCKNTNVALTTYDDASEKLGDNILMFIKDSSSELVSLLINSLWVISEENLLNIFKRIETKTKHQMSERDKNIYLNKLEEQLEYINKQLNNAEKRITYK